jgi:putative YphP/YqiW family bacilliredoxin
MAQRVSPTPTPDLLVLTGVATRPAALTGGCGSIRYDRIIMLTQRYPEPFIAPMREELTRVGFEELRTPEAVDQAVQRQGTTLMVVNSVCGCAAGKARPGIALSLRLGTRPDHLTTVFAGGDIEATERARGYFAPYPPSSPSVALLKDGKLVYMLERRQIESQPAQAIAEQLQAAYQTYCQ